METLTINQIKSKYPNQWILIGNPELSEPEINGSILSKLTQGIVLYASKDKRELAYKAKELKATVKKTACIYTGEISQNKLFLL
jgi:hypothetical protein